MVPLGPGNKVTFYNMYGTVTVLARLTWMRCIGTLEVDQNRPGTERRCSPGTISMRSRVPHAADPVDRQLAESAH